MTLGSVVNTFQDVYDCEKILITVERAMLTTGYTDYLGYLNGKPNPPVDVGEWSRQKGGMIF